MFQHKILIGLQIGIFSLILAWTSGCGPGGTPAPITPTPTEIAAATNTATATPTQTPTPTLVPTNSPPAATEILDQGAPQGEPFKFVFPENTFKVFHS